MAEEKPILKYVAIGCGILMLLAVTCGGFGFYACQSCVSSGMGQQEAAKGFMDDLQSGNHESAYARMSPGFRARNDRAAFEAALAKHPALSDHGTHIFNSFYASPGASTVGGVLTAADGRLVQIELSIVAGPIADEAFVDSLIVDGFVFGAGADAGASPTPVGR